jgi:hypothetical protein
MIELLRIVNDLRSGALDWHEFPAFLFWLSAHPKQALSNKEVGLKTLSAQPFELCLESKLAFLASGDGVKVLYDGEMGAWELTLDDGKKFVHPGFDLEPAVDIAVAYENERIDKLVAEIKAERKIAALVRSLIF